MVRRNGSQASGAGDALRQPVDRSYLAGNGGIKPMKPHRLAISFEFFPPRTLENENVFWSAIRRLAPLQASFVSLTYGASGSTRDGAEPTLRRIHQELGRPPAAHLTCVGASRGEVDDIARRFWDIGIRHIVGLRGDPIPAATRYEPHRQG